VTDANGDTRAMCQAYQSVRHVPCAEIKEHVQARPARESGLVIQRAEIIADLTEQQTVVGTAVCNASHGLTVNHSYHCGQQSNGKKMTENMKNFTGTLSSPNLPEKIDLSVASAHFVHHYANCI